METARLAKRIWAYIINLVLYLGIGFGASVPFVTLLHLPIVAYIFISLGVAIVSSFLLDILLMSVTHGFNIGCAILGVKYVASDGKRLSGKQVVIRSASESIVIFIVFDLVFFIKNKTERGVIDRLSDSFAIDIRI